MGLPKFTKTKRGNVEFIDNSERCNYSIDELTRAALRDVGKYVCMKFRKSYYTTFKRRKGRVGKYTQYWVRSRQPQPNLQVGLKPNGFYGGFQELGTSQQKRLNLLQNAVKDNIAEIVNIESQYLSALEDEARALSLINEEDYEGGAE